MFEINIGADVKPSQLLTWQQTRLVLGSFGRPHQGLQNDPKTTRIWALLTKIQGLQVRACVLAKGHIMTANGTMVHLPLLSFALVWKKALSQRRRKRKKEGRKQGWKEERGADAHGDHVFC